MVNLIVLILALFFYRIYVINKMLEKFEEITDPEVYVRNPIKFWRMVFSFKKPIIENYISALNYYKLTGALPNTFKARIFKVVKKDYLRNLKNGDYLGLCSVILSVSLIDHDLDYTNNLTLYFPEFNAEFLGGNPNGAYWWPIKDTKSRIEALDKLIKLYS